MLTRFGAVFALTLVVALAATTPAWATIDNLKTYKQAYPGKDPKAYSCKVCHLGAIGKKGDLNAYGLALQQPTPPANPKKLTVDDLRAAEVGDADADGATNLQEIEAGTDPADPASVPPGLTPPPPAATTPAAPEEQTPSSRLPGQSGTLQAYLAGLAGADAWADTGEPAASAGEGAESGEPPKAEYVGVETCATCHAQQFKEFQHSTHARIAVPGDTTGHAQGCEMCHGPGSLHAAAGGGRGVGGIINPRKDPSTCFACHLDKKAEFRLPNHHPVLEGKMSCADCHSAHGAEVRPWSATTLNDTNEACFKCHKEQRGPFVFEHEAVREGCTTCHKVHGSIHEKMLIARDSNLCLRCHTQTNYPTIGKSSHASRLPSATCWSGGCHTAPHGSNFDDHLRY